MRCVVLLGALVGWACAEAPLPVEETVPPPDFAAVTETENLFLPVDILLFVPCANGGVGEEVLLEGILHVLISFTESAAGTFRVKLHFQPQGLTGTGLTTGDKYQGTGVTQEELNLGPGLGDTFINNFRMIGQGPGNNFLVHETFHIQFNANGELTAFIDNFSIECR